MAGPHGSDGRKTWAGAKISVRGRLTPVGPLGEVVHATRGHDHGERGRPPGRAAVHERLLHGPLPGQVPRPRAQGDPSSQRHRRLADRGQRGLELRPQRGRRPCPRGVGQRPGLLRGSAQGDVGRPRAHPRHERQRRARVDVLLLLARPGWPVLPAERGPGAGRLHDQGLQRLARRGVVRRAPRPLHPAVAVRLHPRARMDGGGDPPHGRPRAATRSRSTPTRIDSGCPTTTATSGTRPGRPARTPTRSWCSTSGARPSSCLDRRSTP